MVSLMAEIICNGDTSVICCDGLPSFNTFRLLRTKVLCLGYDFSLLYLILLLVYDLPVVLKVFSSKKGEKYNIILEIIVKYNC